MMSDALMGLLAPGTLHLDVFLDIGAIPTHGDEPGVELICIDAIGALREMRTHYAAGGGHGCDGAALVCIHPHDLAARAAATARDGVLEVPRSRANGHDAGTVGRPCRPLIEAGILSEPLGAAVPIGPRLVDVSPPALVVGPRDEPDPAPVRRPGGMMLGHLQLRCALRCAVRVILDPEPVERHERDAASVRGRRHVTDLLRDKRGFVRYLVIEIDQRSDLHAHVEFERHRYRIAVT